MNPEVIIPVDHSVGIDVREDDYYGIKVKYAKKAGSVENLPELVPIETSDDVVAFKLGNRGYSKRVTDVETAKVALYDKKGRDLSTLADSLDYESLVDQYLAGKLLVQSVNGETGNVVLTKADLGLDLVDNTPDLDKPVSNATRTALNTKQDKLQAGSNIRIEGNVISTDVDLSPALEYTDRKLEEYNDSVVENIQVGQTQLYHKVLTEIEPGLRNVTERVSNIEPIVTANSQAIEDVKDDVEEVKEEVENIDLTPFAKSVDVDSAIAEAMAGEQIQDDAMKGDIQALQRDLGAEVTNRENADTQLRADYTSAINTAVGQIRVALDNYYTKAQVDALINPLREAIEAIDFSNYYTKTESDAKYVTLTDFNAAIANLQEQITNNIGRVLTSDPSENNRVWVEQA